MRTLEESPLIVIICFVSLAWNAARPFERCVLHARNRFWELMLGCMLASLNAEASPNWRAHIQHAVRASRKEHHHGSVAMQPGSRDALICHGFHRRAAYLSGLVVYCNGGCVSVDRCRACNTHGSQSSRNCVLVYIGLIGYPLYLWHWPLLSFANLPLQGADHAHQASLVGVAFALATLTYRLSKDQFDWSPHTVLAAAVTVALGMAGCAGTLINLNEICSAVLAGSAEFDQRTPPPDRLV